MQKSILIKTRKKNFFGLFTSKKKAIIIINVEVHIGFDFRKIKIKADNSTKTILLSEFPKPEIFSIEPSIKFYDIQNGLLNKFSSEDLTAVNEEAKEHIIQKVPESNLMPTANQEAMDTILLMHNLVETIGWRLDYSALELPNGHQSLLDQ